MLFPPLLSGVCLSILFPLVSASQLPFTAKPQSHTQDYVFDPLLHLPGISPYFDAIGAGLNHRAPRDCNVTAASYLVRHSSIYANDYDYETFIEPFIAKINSTYGDDEKSRQGWTGPLKFLTKWKTPIPHPSTQLEKLTPEGKNSSHLVAAHLLSKYPLLVPTTTRIYSDSKSRSRDTALAFAESFPQHVAVVEVSADDEDEGVAYRALLPHKACKAFNKKPGDEQFMKFVEHYTQPIIARLKRFSPVSFSAKDIVGMQQMCGYESAINGKVSKLCGVFGDDEWMGYEYAWDLKYSYMVGYKNPLSPYLGWPWISRTSDLMGKLSRMGDKRGEEEHDGQRFFISFTHREVPPVVAMALGLFNTSNEQGEEWSTEGINWSRAWKMAELIPFLGHVGVEKLTCSRSGDDEVKEDYIRVIANTAPRPIPGCQDGPGASCRLDLFEEFVERGMDKYSDFDGVCGEKKDKGKQNTIEKAGQNLDL